MYLKNQIENIIAFDLETVSEYKDLAMLKDKNPRLADLWEKRCDYLRRKHEDNQGLTCEEIYEKKAGLQAEYGKIICASIGYVRFDDDNNAIIKTKSFYSEDEAELLTRFLNFLKAVEKKLPDVIFAGHAIKRFDIPFLCKRLLINGMELPEQLNPINKKPWEMNICDISDIWSFGAWQESFTSLDTLTTILGIPSPKSDIDGSKVGEVFWKDGNLTRIVNYCEQDVAAVINIILKISGFDIVESDRIISVS